MEVIPEEIVAYKTNLILLKLTKSHPMCVNQTYSFQNKSSNGCDSLNVGISGQEYYFNWNFGDCDGLNLNIINDTLVGNNIFPDINYSYSRPESIQSYAKCC